MLTIHTYTDTKCELEMAKTRLNLLIDKKISIYTKYFSMTPNLENIMVDGGLDEADKMADYLHELNEIDLGTGMSLVDEIIYQQKNINKLQSYLDTMNSILSKMNGIEHQLFYEIVFKGTKISKAIDMIAELNDKDSSTIWKNYYTKIKKELNKLKIYKN